uniref:ORF 3 protein n=1 Tax=Methanothermobacter marburgensis TaxID=145263 RepID=Q50804_9EURY|nr:ORF 3 [Methanothermobacter marburgensis]
MFLREHPEFHGKVKFLATGKPTRQQIKEYRDYADSVKSTVDEINSIYGKSTWKPIEYIHRADYELVAAAFKNYDCLIVNPLADGMNIVPKEAALMNEKSGTVILSENAGCYEELAEYAIGVNPFDMKGNCRCHLQVHNNEL